MNKISRCKIEIIPKNQSDLKKQAEFYPDNEKEIFKEINHTKKADLLS